MPYQPMYGGGSFTVTATDTYPYQLTGIGGVSQ